jgi:ElaB/YqjD/DUF883 family membrane-anchored ribosome-binding protein
MATTTRTTATGDVVAGANRIAETISDVSAEAGERLTVMAGSASEAVRDADRSLRRSSDQTLGIVAGAALGFATGLLVSGAHRLLVILSLLPVLLVGLAAMERLDRASEASDLAPSKARPRAQ